MATEKFSSIGAKDNAEVRRVTMELLSEYAKNNLKSIVIFWEAKEPRQERRIYWNGNDQDIVFGLEMIKRDILDVYGTDWSNTVEPLNKEDE